ncbi:glycosyl transferase group 1 [Compostibacillus humi]|uniref:Glycosyl transferase group 1 n=1 Tax=Compostibacillus humi TaxID=1245525 RepID=A0A8J2TN67_9BACI|nr:glycosyltransferase family 4 protein [Compostibacillus humi]GFZ79966.1 glycosyl transferase group 1 [Compostibacillus humi]
MKRILFIESRYNSFYGAQKSLLKLVQSLDEREFEYKIVTTSDGNFKKGFEENNIDVDVIKLGEKANVFGGKILDYTLFDKLIVIIQIIIFNIKLLNYIRKNQIDIIYVNDLRAFLYSILATKLLNKKNVWYIRTDINSSFLTNLGLSLSDNIIIIAQGVLRRIPKNKIKKYNNKITNIYTGFDFKQFKIYDKKESKLRLGISSEKFVIGYLGSINERKGIDLLIDSYINVSKIYDDLHLLLIGDVSLGYEEYWEQQLNKLIIADVPFTIKPYRKNVSEGYSAMDIFVLPSNSEGLPRVVIEAMAHKIPVIATDVGGISEVIPNNEIGYLIKKGNQYELIKAIELLKENEDYRIKMSKNGQKYCITKFNHKKFSEDINKFFLDL